MNRRFPVVLVILVCAALFAAPAGALAFGPLSSVASYGEGAGQIKSPGSLAVAPDGTSYVADFSNERISVFSAQGAFLFAFGKDVSLAGGNLCTAASGCKAGTVSSSAGGMNGPESVALDSAGNVYVADLEMHRIDVFTAQGAFLRAFGEEVNATDHSDVCTAASGCEEGVRSEAAGGMDSPSGLGTDSAGNVYVADSGNNRVDVFTAQGAFLRAFGEEVNATDHSDFCTAASSCEEGAGSGAAGAMYRPYDVKVAPNGQLVVSDDENNRIDVFTTAGGFVRAFGKEVNPSGGDVCTTASGCQAGTSAADAGAFESATAIAVDAANGIYVADSSASRISQFAIDGNFIRAFGAGVISGGNAFQICTAATGCQEGSHTQVSGGLPSVDGVAVDCRGAVYGASYESSFARVERFGEPGTLLPPCPPPAQTAPVVPIAAPAKPSNKIKFGKLKLNKKMGTATLIVKVPGPGSLILKGNGLKKVKRVAKKASSMKLPVALVGKAKKKLNKAGKAKVKAKLTFSPTGGSAGTQAKQLTLKKTLAG